MGSVGPGVSLGRPPSPAGVQTLDDLATLLRELRAWSTLSLRDLAKGIEDLRRVRSIHDSNARPTYGKVQNLFQTGRRWLDEATLVDALRVMLNRRKLPVEWREAQVAEWLKAYRAAQGNPIDDVRAAEFRFGPIHSSCRILEGDGERIISADQIRVVVKPIAVRLPAELASWRTDIARECMRRRRSGERYPWNGARYAVDDLVVSRRGAQETPTVTLRLKHSDYYTFLATQRLDDQFEDGTTPRIRYLHGRDPYDVPDFMRSSFGLNAALVTADNWLVVAHRSDHLGVGRGQWNSSANEGLSRSLDSADGAPPNLFRAMGRGIDEELRLEPSLYDLDLLAFAVVMPLSQWCALFLARLHTITKSEFEARVGRGVPDAWEHRQFDYVEFEPESVLRYLVSADRCTKWAPAAPVLYYLSLVNAYGRQQVENVTDIVLRGVSTEYT